MQGDKKYWFPAKRYGWGWGIRSAWQGWVVLGTFVLLLVLGFLLFSPEEQFSLFLGYVGVISALLLAICWRKGAPPRWRWGGDE
ncbi:MAG: hypothetical protein ACRETN_09565 [Nevskiales bacterium]